MNVRTFNAVLALGWLLVSAGACAAFGLAVGAIVAGVVLIVNSFAVLLIVRRIFAPKREPSEAGQ